MEIVKIWFAAVYLREMPRYTTRVNKAVGISKKYIHVPYEVTK